MAPATPATTWPRRGGRAFLRALVLVLAVARPASSQNVLRPPPGAAVSGSFSPPSPPAGCGDGGGGGAFSLTTSLLFVGIIAALFMLGFFSAYLRHPSGITQHHGVAVSESTPGPHIVRRAIEQEHMQSAGRKEEGHTYHFTNLCHSTRLEMSFFISSM